MNETVRKRRSRSAAYLLALPLVVGGCYHAVIETGRTPSGETFENEWAHSFIGGLVPPSVVETASQCPNGVARVETQHSFLNMVASFVTFNLYSPMTITVQCAAPGTALLPDAAEAEGRHLALPDGASRAELEETLNRATDLAAETKEPVTVTFGAIR